MFKPSVGICSLAVSLPNKIRTKDFWKKNYPELVEKAEQLASDRASVPMESICNEVDPWIEGMIPYLSDPFQGAVERRVLEIGENALILGYRAAYQALEAAKLTAEEIDLAIVSTLFSAEIVPGDAAPLAAKLGLNCPAWNVESACSGGMVALQIAYAQVRSGECRNVLVVISGGYTQGFDGNAALLFALGDGATAFVVSEVNPGQGVIGKKIQHIGETYGAYDVNIIFDELGKTRFRLRQTESGASILHNTQKKYLRACCEGAASNAGITLDKIDLFSFNNYTAWHTKACARALGVDCDRTIDLYSYIGNLGPVLPPLNLYFAAQAGRIHENDLVLLYAFGYSGNAGAIVMRWGDVALGPLPENSEKLIDAARAKVPMAMAT